MTNEEINYIVTNLNSNNHSLSYEGKNIEAFSFTFNGIKNKLLISEDYENILIIENHMDYKNIPDNHINGDGTACLSIEKITNIEELVFSIVDWNNSLYQRINGGPHTHGYRHDFEGYVEKMMSEMNIPMMKKYAGAIEIEDIKQYFKKNEINHYLEEELEVKWRQLLEEWDEKMS